MPLEGLQVDRYKLIRLLRRGGMSEIYLAEDTRMPRQVAVKVMQAEGSLYPDANIANDASRLFEREMRAVTTLDSPYILPLLDFGKQTLSGSEITYMVMLFRPEGSLADWIKQRVNAAPLSVADIAYIIHQAGEGLQHAHDHNIIHLDVKPSNLLIRHRPETPNRPDVLLADFGIAKFTGASQESKAIRGTLEYMAPEQWRSYPVPASDQYA
ncbi:MAG TPA: serine/threonine protein kinase, partial [Ktedonobacter sp.]|nr:serine/threonine protein kinase [Ktedonobacter sp.]